jgi:hypothetical protein
LPELIATLEAFVQEHKRCSDLEGGVDGDVVWMSCDCGGVVTGRVPRDMSEDIR